MVADAAKLGSVSTGAPGCRVGAVGDKQPGAGTRGHVAPSDHHGHDHDYVPIPLMSTIHIQITLYTSSLTKS